MKTALRVFKKTKGHFSAFQAVYKKKTILFLSSKRKYATEETIN